MDPEISLLVIRVADLERARRFYEALGLRFESERHGTGPEHISAILGGIVFELYPRGERPSTQGTRIGFRVASLTSALSMVEQRGGRILHPPAPSPDGLRAVVADPDGHTVELTGSADPGA